MRILSFLKRPKKAAKSKSWDAPPPVAAPRRPSPSSARRRSRSPSRIPSIAIRKAASPPTVRPCNHARAGGFPRIFSRKTEMSAPDTAIAVAPILDALQPLVTAAVSTAVAGVVGIAIALYNSWKWRGSTIDAAHRGGLRQRHRRRGGQDRRRRGHDRVRQRQGRSQFAGDHGLRQQRARVQCGQRQGGARRARRDARRRRFRRSRRGRQGADQDRRRRTCRVVARPRWGCAGRRAHDLTAMLSHSELAVLAGRSYSGPQSGHVALDVRYDLIPREGEVVVVMPGTHPADALDWLRDLRVFPSFVPPLGPVHSGFGEGAAALWPKLERDLPPYGLITYAGHSLGGALAQGCAAIHARRWPDVTFRLVTFGAPRISFPEPMVRLARPLGNASGRIPARRRHRPRRAARSPLSPSDEAESDRRLASATSSRTIRSRAMRRISPRSRGQAMKNPSKCAQVCRLRCRARGNFSRRLFAPRGLPLDVDSRSDSSATTATASSRPATTSSASAAHQVLRS